MFVLLTQRYWSPQFCSKIVKIQSMRKKKNAFLQPEGKKETAFNFNSAALIPPRARTDQGSSGQHLWFTKKSQSMSEETLRSALEKRRDLNILWRDAASSCTDLTRQEVRRRNDTEHPVTFQNKTPRTSPDSRQTYGHISMYIIIQSTYEGDASTRRASGAAAPLWLLRFLFFVKLSH